MSKFHEDWAKNVSSRLLTCFHYKHIKKTAPPLAAMKKTPSPGGHVFLPIQTIFEFICCMKQILFPCFYCIHIKKTAPPPGGHVFPPTMTIFELKCCMMIRQKNVTSRKTHVLTKFYEDWTNNVTSRVFTCFHYIHILLRPLCPYIDETNVLNKFHDDWAKIVTSRVFTRFLYSHAPPPGGHVFQRTGTIFELNQHII
ncbi:hypothetical protein DPMN_095493 [Dreissena polymorpha]|uniref:Uncharacterized protein n=1 Tax=Dreissena polymorpha TaxID=45954 RepID=A0A9D4L9G5_DREPO|nr:hypothetical protein DPMN_095493 [Dreissena polymorpha]